MSEQESITTQHTYDWDDMLAESDYTTLMFIRKLMHRGEYEAAKKGIDRLFEYETKVEKREMKEALINLMQHIILWKSSSHFQTGEQVENIITAHENVEYCKEEGTELNNDYIWKIWDEAFEQAKKFASIELNTSVNLYRLTWQEVFEEEYSMFKTEAQDDGHER